MRSTAIAWLGAHGVSSLEEELQPGISDLRISCLQCLEIHMLYPLPGDRIACYGASCRETENSTAPPDPKMVDAARLLDTEPCEA
ncbi:hypothetical protein NDU88_003079 [Pleurodeles waltl]|uniref:Uncharacterized protein n=1 Tax=Pleurodeles waltl TaxID=8319 RepID=A0AAV7UDA9_PLEWA|nr:hypothetical protein NDU88_003079 [Pleurodeles waltl]